MSDPSRRLSSLSSRARRGAVSAMLTVAAGVAIIGPASAASERVRSACTSDYLKFCSQYDPDSYQTVNCMQRHANRISRTCRIAFQEEGPRVGQRRR